MAKRIEKGPRQCDWEWRGVFVITSIKPLFINTMYMYYFDLKKKRAILSKSYETVIILLLDNYFR